MVRNRLAYCSSDSRRACSASFMSVTSRPTPVTRIASPAALRCTSALPTIQWTLPSGHTTRNSSAPWVFSRKRPLLYARIRSRSSGCTRESHSASGRGESRGGSPWRRKNLIRADYGSFRHMPIPDADAGGILGQPEPFHGFAVCRLGLFHLGDVAGDGRDGDQIAVVVPDGGET